MNRLYSISIALLLLCAGMAIAQGRPEISGQLRKRLGDAVEKFNDSNPIAGETEAFLIYTRVPKTGTVRFLGLLYHYGGKSLYQFVGDGEGRVGTLVNAAYFLSPSISETRRADLESGRDLPLPADLKLIGGEVELFSPYVMHIRKPEGGKLSWSIEKAPANS